MMTRFANSIACAFLFLALAFPLAARAQCPGGVCPRPTYQPSAFVYQPPAATLYQLADAAGQVWQHADPNYLASFVASRNANRRAGDSSDSGSNTGPAPILTSPGDPYGFGGWLNAARARAGLRPVAYDAGLTQDAATNSSLGFGHRFMGRARRQNAGMGPLGAVESMWCASPAHASALFDPSITAYGIACVSGVWTYSAR